MAKAECQADIDQCSEMTCANIDWTAIDASVRYSEAKQTVRWAWCAADVHHNDQMVQLPSAWLLRIPAAQGT